MRRLMPWGIACAMALEASTDAATLRVPWDYSTLHAALDVAVAGDTVLVGPGTYSIYEKRQSPSGAWINAIAFLRTGVALVSEAGPAVTIIDHVSPSGDAGFYAFGQSDVVVHGFTFTGMGEGGVFQFNFGGLVVITNCVFENISSAAIGGVMSDFEIYGCTFRSIHGSAPPGVFTVSCTLRIEDSEFEDISPGAVRCWYDTGWVHPIRLEVRRCRFVDIGGSAAALATTAASPGNQFPMFVEDCWFERCVGTSTGPGAILMVSLAPQLERVIRRCTFVDNHTTGRGGAILLDGSLNGPPILVEGCTFVGNSQDFPWSDGGSAVNVTEGGAHLSNNIFAASTGVSPAVGARPDAVVTTHCNVFWDNLSGHVGGFTLDPTDLIADPEFCNASANDFTVQSSSPCLPQNNPSCTALIGAWPSGCGAVSVESKSWGRIKADYRSKGE